VEYLISGVFDKKYFTLADEMQSAGNSMKVYQLKGSSTFIFTTDDNTVCLVIYKEPSGLSADLKGRQDRGVYISRKNKNGIIHSQNREMDYFEF
jgi:hypothetical protein